MVPPPPIIAALLAAVLMAVILLFLAFIEWFGRRPGLRFRVAVAAGWGALVLLLVALPQLGFAVGAIDVLASISIVVAATLALFVVWSLITWGFTLNMLLVLAENRDGLSLLQWADRYTGGAGILGLTRNRLDVLVSSRLVEALPDERFVLTPRGPIAVKTLLLLRATYGIGGSEWKIRN